MKTGHQASIVTLATSDTGRVDLFIDAAGGQGLSEQLYEQIREAIAAGRLRPGDQLPPSRDAARQLGISRHTVTTAYGRLVAEGFVCGRAGGGSFVAELDVPDPDPDPGTTDDYVSDSTDFGGDDSGGGDDSSYV